LSFDVDGVGLHTIKSQADLDRSKVLPDMDKELPLLRPILEGLRRETEGKTFLVGFIGAPWTLVEGSHQALLEDETAVQR
jgi:uroporphyrinogen-III decarboxylase